jgi:hemoglobin
MRKLASILVMITAAAVLSGGFTPPARAAAQGDQMAGEGMTKKAKKAKKKASKKKGKSLYERLGGTEAITAVVDDFVGRVAADTRINARFANANIPRLKTLLVEQICMATGGPCTYTGRDMVASHKGMNITDVEFNALVEDLVASLNQFKVGKAEQDELLGALASMRGDIVAR